VRLLLSLGDRHADAYHTCYCLSGLASAQHRVLRSDKRKEEILRSWDSSHEDPGVQTTPLVVFTLTCKKDPMMATIRKISFVASLSWNEEEGGSKIIGNKANRVVSPTNCSCLQILIIGQNPAHPVFNLTNTHAEGIMAHFYKQRLPNRSVNVNNS
jgi:protein farnesyltransferase subunit beta